MTTYVSLISTAEALLQLLRQSPTSRMVLAEGKIGREGRAIRAVVERHDRPLPVITPLAYLCRGSEADELISAAIRADSMPEGAAEWARLPVRFHEFYDACLLPEHPHAPCEPGGWSAPWTEPEEGVCIEDLTDAEMTAIGREVREEWERVASQRIALGPDAPDEDSR